MTRGATSGSQAPKSGRPASDGSIALNVETDYNISQFLQDGNKIIRHWIFKKNAQS